MHLLDLVDDDSILESSYLEVAMGMANAGKTHARPFGRIKHNMRKICQKWLVA